MELSDYLDGASDEYVDYAREAGADLTEQYHPPLVCNLGDLHSNFKNWISAKRNDIEQHCVKVQPYHRGETLTGSRLPSTVGYDEHNTKYFMSRDPEIKLLLGGREGFEKMGMQYEHSLCTLLITPPGSTIPWHSDTMQNWRDQNADINPHLVMAGEKAAHGLTYEQAHAGSQSDIGQVARRIIAVTPWHWGHFIEMKSTFITDWESGDVWNSPPCVWHLTGNAGVTLRISVTVTGVEIAD